MSVLRGTRRRVRVRVRVRIRVRVRVQSNKVSIRQRVRRKKSNCSEQRRKHTSKVPEIANDRFRVTITR